MELSFNSKMVRLKGGLGRKNVTTLVKFQFQNGTIKSTRALLLAIILSAVSIPKWYD